jgi:hypothetical protein
MPFTVKRETAIVLWSAAALLSSALSAAQTAPDKERWGEQFNSPGATLTSKESGRTQIQGKTVITYNLVAAGMPKDQHYVLWVLNLGADPRAGADAYLNSEGKVVSVLADPDKHVAEDPINLKLFGSKGEPFKFGLISDDGKLRAFAQIVPFPIEAVGGSCHLSAVETGPYYLGMFVRATGFQPDEELAIETSSEGEGGQIKAKASSDGSYNSGLFPFVKGKRAGKTRFSVAGKTCKVAIEFPWGEGSQQYQ